MPEPSWSAQLVLIGGNRPPAPSSLMRASVRLRFSKPQRSCSGVITLPLPYLVCATRIASTRIIPYTTPRVYITLPRRVGSSRLPFLAPYTLFLMSCITGKLVPLAVNDALT